ncbi:DEAD/DEAH box helicase family protein [Nannocystis sp.]|uniref:DEAD/DEAH box helicase family protein n=1 Tax=Nannocystis sp. TaxID=1962667 RepID=UPI0025D764DD|nr:DEAD/DEAH box helicase family protein [Nannocystis sp.]MBK7823814.1 DEAD/DEAH box helicase family protein [Nannocystis sp.]
MRELPANERALTTRGDDGELRVAPRRMVGRWAELTLEERGDVLALIDLLGADGGSVHFELAAPPGERWYASVRRGDADFAALPGFVAGEEQHFLDALRGALGQAEAADLLAAFVQRSGVRLLRDDMVDALRRGAQLRLLTGDYLGITAPQALRELCELAAEYAGLQVKVYCSEGRSFHPKAYLFRRGGSALAYVGSSNWSEEALTDGVEWNLRAIDAVHPGELRAIAARFERLWRAPAAVLLTQAWIEDYSARAPEAQRLAWDPPPPRPEPHAIQRRALAALASTREAGHVRGLVVLATGLGKTLLAALDALQMGARRVLFVAHRAEILEQARRAFAWVLPDRSAGRFMGGVRETAAELVFASVQTLGRPEQLRQWAADHFDLIVIDEFHHAAALGYRRVLTYFQPQFMLGLTATPERSDGAELLTLCDDNLVFRADLTEAIAAGRLVPFAYHGLKDSVDYKAIPWLSGRFDPEALSQALATQSHAEQALQGYLAHAPDGPRRGLWFCASIRHAEFMAEFLRERGIRAVAVHSEGGAPRSASLRELEAGRLEAITTVDVFNEGVDVADVNVVVLLRPTESRVVFLQQIGRGLRLPVNSHKPRLVILDFIGNHRSFLARPQALFDMLGVHMGGRAAIGRLRDRSFELPPGCSVDIEVELIDMLARLGRVEAGDPTLVAARRLRDELGRRPTLSELGRAGVQVRAPARNFGSWWDLLAELGALSDAEARVVEVRRDALVALERSAVREVGPWTALRRWLEAGGVAAPSGGVDAATLATLWPAGLRRSGDAVVLRVPVEVDDLPVLEAMLDEVAAAREDEARRRAAVAALPAGLRCKVGLNGLWQPNVVGRSGKALKPPKPILRFKRGAMEEGVREVWVEGDPYLFDFVSIAVNVATTREGGPNVLGAILAGLFGPDAGKPGTDHSVVLREREGRLMLEVVNTEEPAEVPALPYFADLAVACGLAPVQHADAVPRAIRVRSELRLDPRRHFVVRASGDSMNGGARPIRDGELVLCARLPAAPPDLVDGKPCLLVAAVGPDMSEAMIKVPTRGADGAWVLRSWSEGQVDLAIDRWEDLRVVARVIEVVTPL